MAELIRTDGTRQTVTPAAGAGAAFTLDELYRHTGASTIEIVHTHDGRLLVLDEEGKLRERAYNVPATRLYLYGAADPIVGDVLVCDLGELE